MELQACLNQVNGNAARFAVSPPMELKAIGKSVTASASGSLTEATGQIRRSYPRFPKRVGGKGGAQALYWRSDFSYLRSVDLLPLESLDASEEALKSIPTSYG